MQDIQKYLKCTLHQSTKFWTGIHVKNFNTNLMKWLAERLMKSLISKVLLPPNDSDITLEGYVVVELLDNSITAEIRPPDEMYAYICDVEPPKDKATTIPSLNSTSTTQESTPWELSTPEKSSQELSTEAESNTSLSTESSTKVESTPELSTPDNSSQELSTEAESNSSLSTESSTKMESTPELSTPDNSSQELSTETESNSTSSTESSTKAESTECISSESSIKEESTMDSSSDSTDMEESTVDLSTESSDMEESTVDLSTESSVMEELTTENSSMEVSTLPTLDDSVDRKLFCIGNRTSYDGLEIDWPDTELGEVAKADCPKGTYGDAYWTCSHHTGEFVGTPDQNCTVINCSEPSLFQLVNVSSTEMLYVAERLAQCGSDSSMMTLDLLELMRKEKNQYRKGGLSSEKDDSKMRKDVTTFVRVFDRLLEKDAVVWSRMKGEKRIQTSMEIIKETEETAWLMGCTEDNMTLKRNNLAIEVFSLGNEGKTLELSLNSLSVGDVKLPSNLIAETATICQKQVQRGVVSAYRNVEDYLNPDLDTLSVGSGVLGVSLGGDSNAMFNLPPDKKIQIRLNHLEIQFGFAEPVCVFLDWNYSEKQGKFGVWETEGCEVTDTGPYYTVCECNHLTNFAVLMNFAGPEPEGKDRKILSLLSLVFSCLSVVALVLTIIIYTTVKSFHNRRNTITCNLAVCLLAMNILVQTGLERVDTVVCKIVSGLLQYAVLSAFLWMLLEGILLYRMVILVFEVKTIRLPFVYIIAYGFPAIIVVMSSFARPDDIIRNNYCWPSQENGLIWSVTGPILLIITVNIIIFGMTLNAASKLKSLVSGSTENKKKNLVQRLKGSISLMWLLGFSWAVGFFYVPNTQIAAYLFVILNGLQGVFLFLTQMVFNNPVRKKLFAIYKESITKLTSPSGTWQFLLGKHSNSKDSTSGQESSRVDSESGTVRPSAPPQPDIYTVQIRHFEKETGHREPCHPFCVNSV